jgi:hypothetical protein
MPFTAGVTWASLLISLWLSFLIFKMRASSVSLAWLCKD